METKKDGQMTLAVGQTFRIVKHGFDKNEVFAFIASLIDQNNEYAKKLEHLDSLRKLAEHTVIEANKMAESIKVEIVEKAREEATAIMREAEKKAREEVERIIADAEESSQNRISAAEQLASDTLKRAEDEAGQIKAPAADEATRITTEARQKAEELAREITTSAEEQRQSVLESAQRKAQEMKEAAEKQALIAQQEAEELLARTKKIASGMKEQFGRIYEEMLSIVEEDVTDAEQTRAASGEEEIATPELNEPHAASEQSEAETEEVR